MVSHLVTAVVGFGFGIFTMSAKGKQLISSLLAKTKVI